MSDSPITESPITQSPITPPPPKRRWRITRRGFLIGSGIGVAGLALGITVGTPYARLKIAEMLASGQGQPGSFPVDPFAWFEVLPDSRVRLFLTKVEMGQGVHTALAQIAAEDLGVALSDLEIVQASTSQGPADGNGTSGSSSVATVYQPLRQAAATLHQMLRAEAARVLGVPADALSVAERAFVVTAAPEQRVEFGALVAEQKNWEVPEEGAPLKPDSEFTLIGQPLPRVDIPAKVTGEAVYGYDIKLPGMLYGAVARPPTLAARLTAAQPGAAATMPGVHQVVIENDFAGVVATSRAAAHAAVDALELTWDEGKLWQQAELEEIITVGNGNGITIQRAGDAPALLEANPALIQAEYRSPFAVQASLEPQAALVDVQLDRVRIWVSTQMQARVRSLVAETLGVDEAIVEVTPTYLGGGFGRKTGFEVAVEAARLSKAAGVPVHVGWTRTEEMRYGYFRPPTHHQLAAVLDANGQISAIEHRQASGDVAFGFFPAWLATVMGADFGSYRGAQIHYAIPNRHTIAWRHELPVRTGWWRGLGLLANTFAVESFVDELAHAAGIDPLQFRLNHLPDDTAGQRMRAVLQAAAEKAGWGTPLPEGRARGIACCTDVGTVVAEVAEVSLDAATNRIRVHQVTAAMDCGLTINPDGARAQIEGNIMWGVGSTLIEEMRIKDGQVDINNFDTYPLLTLRDAPHVETILLEAGDGRPRGVGEPPIGPVAAAIGNALFALTGKRLRQLPMTPERVAAA